MKKNVKQLCAVVLAASVAALTGCGGSGRTPESAAAKAAPAETAAVKTAPAENAPEGNAAAEESVSQDTDIVGAMLVDFTTMDPMDTSDTLSGGIQRMIRTVCSVLMMRWRSSRCWLPDMRQTMTQLSLPST